MKTLKEIEKEAIEAALRETNYCIPEAAQRLGIAVGTVYNKIKYHKIDYPWKNSRGRR